MKKQAKNVAEYIKHAPMWARPTLRELRRVIRSVAPNAKESISYGMPYYSQNGRVAYFGVYTNHCSFHWISGEDKKVFKKELESQHVKGSTLHIPRGKKVPVRVIQKLVKEHIRRNEAKMKK